MRLHQAKKASRIDEDTRRAITERGWGEVKWLWRRERCV